MIKRAGFCVLVALISSCQPAPEPLLQIEGWTPQGEIAIYTPDTLWEAINGAADTFLAYGFQLLRLQQFSAGDVTVTVSVYDMGAPINAFGVYRAEMPADLPVVDACTEAVVSPPYQCLLLKDRYYVKVDAHEGDIDDASGAGLVNAIAQGLPGSTELPAALAELPFEGMVAGSARYTRERLLGLAELNDAVHARYLDDAGTGYQVFVVLPHEDGSLEEAWDALAQRWQWIEHGGVPVLYREVPYEGLVGVVRGETGLLGVAGVAGQEALLDKLGRLTNDS
jgi:hypothetical protein